MAKRTLARRRRCESEVEVSLQRAAKLKTSSVEAGAAPAHFRKLCTDRSPLPHNTTAADNNNNGTREQYNGGQRVTEHALALVRPSSVALTDLRPAKCTGPIGGDCERGRQEAPAAGERRQASGRPGAI